MASLGSLVVSLAMDTAKFTGDVGKAAQQMARLTAEAGKIGAAIGASIGIGVKVIGGLVKSSIDAADETSKMAQSLGVTTEEMSRLAYAADLAGLNQQELGASMAKLARQAADAAAGGKSASDVFSAMGVVVKNTDGTLKDTTTILGEVAERFKSYEDGAAKTALAQELFGKGAAKLIPFLNQGRDGLAELAREADILGITLSTSAGEAAEEFNDNLTRLSAAQQGLGRQIAEKLLPTLQNLTTGLFNSAKNADLFGRAATIAATGVKLLVSAGAIIVGVFNTLGEALGGVAGSLVALFSGRFSDAFNIANMTVLDFASNVRSSANTVSLIWDETAGQIEGKAPSLGGKIAAPIVLAAEKVRVGAKAIKDQAQKAYDEIEKRLGSLQFDVDTQGASDRIKGLIELTRQGATGEQAQRFLDLSDAVEKFRATSEAAADAQRRQNDLAAEAGRVFDETRTPLERYTAEMERLQELRAADAITSDTYTRKVLQSANSYRDAITQVADTADKTKSIASDLGMTFSSAFEDAIVGGQKFSDVLKGIEQDILRILARKLVTEPLADATTSFLGGLFKGGSTGAGLFGNVAAGLLGSFGGAAAPAASGTVGPGMSGAGFVVNVGATQGMSRATALQQGEQIGRGIQLAVGRNG